MKVSAVVCAFSQDTSNMRLTSVVLNPLGAKALKTRDKNMTYMIVNTFEARYQIMGPVLFFDPHNLAFRTVAQEQQWSLHDKI